MSFLLRKAVGGFVLSQTCILNGLSFVDDAYRAQQALLPLDFPFRGEEFLLLEKAEINRLAQGQFLPWKDLHNRAGDVLREPVDEKILPVYTTTREFVGLAKWKFDQTAGFSLRSAKIIPI